MCWNAGLQINHEVRSLAVHVEAFWLPPKWSFHPSVLDIVHMVMLGHSAYVAKHYRPRTHAVVRKNHAHDGLDFPREHVLNHVDCLDDRWPVR